MRKILLLFLILPLVIAQPSPDPDAQTQQAAMEAYESDPTPENFNSLTPTQQKSAVQSMDYDEPGNGGQYKSIAADYFSQDGNIQGDNKQEFTRYLQEAEDINVDSIDGDLCTYNSATGLITNKDGTQSINIYDFPKGGSYSFSVNADGNIQLNQMQSTPQGTKKSATDFTGDVSISQDGKLSIPDGSLNGQTVINGQGITVNPDGSVSGSFHQFANVNFQGQGTLTGTFSKGKLVVEAEGGAITGISTGQPVELNGNFDLAEDALFESRVSIGSRDSVDVRIVGSGLMPDDSEFVSIDNLAAYSTINENLGKVHFSGPRDYLQQGDPNRAEVIEALESLGYDTSIGYEETVKQFQTDVERVHPGACLGSTSSCEPDGKVGQRTMQYMQQMLDMADQGDVSLNPLDPRPDMPRYAMVNGEKVSIRGDDIAVNINGRTYVTDAGEIWEVATRTAAQTPIGNLALSGYDKVLEYLDREDNPVEISPEEADPVDITESADAGPLVVHAGQASIISPDRQKPGPLTLRPKAATTTIPQEGTREETRTVSSPEQSARVTTIPRSGPGSVIVVEDMFEFHRNREPVLGRIEVNAIRGGLRYMGIEIPERMTVREVYDLVDSVPNSYMGQDITSYKKNFREIFSGYLTSIGREEELIN